jgi:hypothetical protein
MLTYRRVSVCALLALLSACRGTDRLEPIVCTTEFRYGLAVFVRDSLTDAPIAAGARLRTFIAGVAVDSSSDWPNAFPPNDPFYDDQALGGAGERAGTYRLVVQRAGYRDWVREGVVVTADECHVIPVTLTARMLPLQ